MNFKLGTGGEVKVFLVFEETKSIKEVNELFEFLKKRDVFTGKINEVYSDISYSGNNNILLGLGKENELTIEKIRIAFFNLGKELINQKVTSAQISLPIINDLSFKKTISAIVEGLLNSTYSFEKYLSEKKLKPTVETFYINPLTKEDLLEETIIETENIIKSIFFTRDLVNEPAITITPKALANIAKENLEPLGVEVEILDKDEIKELNMHAFLTVSKGSKNKPRFIIMKWNGNKESDETIALVGKGLTYDSGGYSLKPSNSMITMYCDMAGASSVIGTINALAKNNVQKNVIGIVAACENLISGKSYKPGDIISSMSGKTIEVNNTDAEGRITLADSLWYATNEIKASKVIDIATLTGACISALGEITTAGVTNNDELMNDVIEAGKEAGEDIWKLPTNDNYRDLIKSSKADISNTGVRGAGTITAGLFLENFIANKTPWVHLDIAGTAFLSKSYGYLPEGATGVLVKTLYNLVKGHVEN